MGRGGRSPVEAVVFVEDVAHKRCTRCGEVKPLADFCAKKRNKSGLSSRCKTCTNEIQIVRRGNAPTTPRVAFVPRACVECGVVKSAEDFVVNEFCRDGHALRCKKCSYLWIEHHLTYKEYQKLLESSQGLCAICLDVMKTVNIDHDHTCCPGRRSCGKCVRGLLCPECNRGIGLLKDDPKVLLAAADYLEKKKKRSL